MLAFTQKGIILKTERKERGEGTRLKTVAKVPKMTDIKIVVSQGN